MFRGDLVKEIIIETLLDSLKILPFLFITFLFVELIEHKFNKKTKFIVESSDKFGPVIGSLFGLIPNCGFSVAATNLYITRVISIGTLISIYLSTSDEMLPILISRNVGIKTILLILGIKFVVGIIFGFIIDSFFTRKKNNEKFNYDLCSEEHCDCKNSILKSSIKHTINTILYVFVISFLINILFEYVSESIISKIFMKNNIFGPFIGSLIGLIPNCGASVALTELFLNAAINFGTCIAGLLTGSGVAILVLFRSNKNFKENITILSILYLIGVLIGIFIEIISILL